MSLSSKRKTELAKDKDIVIELYNGAVAQLGKAFVDKDITTLWDRRVFLGIQNKLPFGKTEFKNLEELLYIARKICGYGY